jgi:hypothetical protein
MMDFAPRRTTHPTAKPAAKTAVKPVAKPTPAPISRLASRPAVKPVTKTVARPTVAPAKPVSKPAMRPVPARPAHPIQAAARPVLKPAAKSAAPAPKPAAKPAAKATTATPVLKKREAPNANNYSLGVRSPFLTNTKVEKRPLGTDIPETSTAALRSTKNVYSSKSPSKASTTKKKHMVTEAPKKHSGWLWTLIVLGVIAAGGGLGYLAYILVFAN